MLENGSNFYMPVAPANSGGFGNGFGGDGWWILLLLLFAGGWGNGFGGGFGGGDLYPWMNNSQNINDGFRDQMLGTQINSIQNGITSGFGDVQNALCSGFAGITNTMNQNTMADMERSFAVQSALQNCCCENRASVADLKYTVATENCADRAAVNDGVRNIMENCNRNNQAILDKLCSLELDAKQDKINDLERQLTMANLAASQTAQTSRLIADNTAQTQYIVNRVAPYPIPAYTVPNPFVPAAV